MRWLGFSVCESLSERHSLQRLSANSLHSTNQLILGKTRSLNYSIEQIITFNCLTDILNSRGPISSLDERISFWMLYLNKTPCKVGLLLKDIKGRACSYSLLVCWGWPHRSSSCSDLWCPEVTFCWPKAKLKVFKKPTAMTMLNFKYTYLKTGFICLFSPRYVSIWPFLINIRQKLSCKSTCQTLYPWIQICKLFVHQHSKVHFHLFLHRSDPRYTWVRWKLKPSQITAHSCCTWTVSSSEPSVSTFYLRTCWLIIILVTRVHLRALVRHFGGRRR